jgi:hypothetical protein
MIGFMLWLLLLVFCWPLALAALLLYPLVWLVLLPFRLIGITVTGALALLGALILVPARVLGGNEVAVPQKRRRRLLPDQSVR